MQKWQGLCFFHELKSTQESEKAELEGEIVGEGNIHMLKEYVSQNVASTSLLLGDFWRCVISWWVYLPTSQFRGMGVSSVAYKDPAILKRHRPVRY